MSLYYETATILENRANVGGSFKARIFKTKELKSKPGQVYALVAEASKWSRVLKDVIEKCGVLGEERKLTPVLALLLTHDLLLSKSGVAAHKDHVLRLAIERHKARLAAEFTKARIRYKFATLDAFRVAVNAGDLDADEGEGEGAQTRHPRWVRVNTIKSSLEKQLDSTFKGYERVDGIAEVLRARGSRKVYYQDANIPNLLALPGRVDLSKTPAYVKGEIIFQDKASCFPAYLLDLKEGVGDVIDGCAAPGNKTTHAAAIVSGLRAGAERKVIAFERDKGRSEILKKMVKLAGAEGIVTVKGASDFIAAKPGSPDYENVGAILLDPSCSGTGIVGRDDAIKLHLPSASAEPAKAQPGKSKKRKRDTKSTPAEPQDKGELTLDLDETTQEEVPLDAADKLAERLTALSTFQLHILTHAMRFPAARKITYSTCSIHFEENEGVVFQALATTVAKERGWRVLRRSEQVEGLKKWEKRGIWEEGKLGGSVMAEGKERDGVLEGCIRCDKQTEDGTMGFFVAAFVREGEGGEWSEPQQRKQGGRKEVDLMDVDVREPAAPTAEQNGDEEEEWDGFSDDEGAADLKAKAEAVVQKQQEEEVKTANAAGGKRNKNKKRKTGK